MAAEVPDFRPSDLAEYQNDAGHHLEFSPSEIVTVDKKGQVTEYGTTETEESIPATPLEAKPVSKTVLRLFYLSVYMQLVNSFDRGIIPGALETIIVDLELTSTEAGSLNSAFLVGLVLAIPVATILSNTRLFRPFALISTGMCLWCACTLLAAAAKSYWHLVALRSLTGVGDALFQVICVPFIDSNAPAIKRARWMSTFVAAYPIGIALGTMVTGYVNTTKYTWRASFILESALMLPAVIIGFSVNFRDPLGTGDKAALISPHKKPRHRRRSQASIKGHGKTRRKSHGSIKTRPRLKSGYEAVPDEEIGEGKHSTHSGGTQGSSGSNRSRPALGKHTPPRKGEGRSSRRSRANSAAKANRFEAMPDIKGDKHESSWKTRILPVLTNPLCLMGCFGDAGLMGVSSGVGYWTVYYAENTLGAPPGVATTASGMATVVASFAGTIAAGRLLDSLGRRAGGKSCAMACFLCAITSALSIPIGLAAFYTNDVAVFFTLFSCFIFTMLMGGGTFPLAILWTVPVEQRVTASAIVSFIVNICGTVPAPIAVGYLNDMFAKKPPVEGESMEMSKTVMYLVVLWMVWPALLGTVVGFMAKYRRVGVNVDKYG